jgi:glycine oxidase
MIGSHPDHANLLALTGGFKVSFGLAHRLAEAVVRMAAGEECGLPCPTASI